MAYGEAWEYDYEQFVTWDVINRNVTVAVHSPWRTFEDFEPLAPPVVIRGSWRNARNTAPKKMNTNITTTHNLQEISSSYKSNPVPAHIFIGSNANLPNGYMESGAKIERIKNKFN